MTWQEQLARARAEPLDERAVAAVVAEVLGGRVEHVSPLAGGLSSLLDLVSLTGASTERVVLRRLLTEWGADEADVRREHAVHAIAHAAGVPAPAVLWSDPTGAAVGRPSLLMEHVPGTPLVAALDTDGGIDAFSDVITTIHDVPPPAAAVLPRHATPDDVVAGIGGTPTSSPLVDATALTRVVRGLATVDAPPDTFTHGDLHGGNVLWDGRSVTGVLDWGGAAVCSRWSDESYAVMDTSLAHGVAAGRRLLDALRARSSAPRPTSAQWGLWFGAALQRGLPTPGEWSVAFAASGCRVTVDEIEGRYVRMVEEYLDDHG